MHYIKKSRFWGFFPNWSTCLLPRFSSFSHWLIKKNKTKKTPVYQKPRVLAAAVAASVCAVYWTRTSFKLPATNCSPASANLSSSRLCIRLVSRCCSLVAAGSNGHSSKPQSRIVCLRRSLVTVSVCTIFKVKKKKKTRRQWTGGRCVSQDP